MSDTRLFAVMFNSNGQIIYCNGHFVHMTGLSLDEVLGRSWNDVFLSPWAGNLPDPFADWFKSKPAAWHHEGDLVTREGESYRVRWNSIPWRDTSGTVVGVASIGVDIAERRRLEQTLPDSAKQGDFENFGEEVDFSGINGHH